MVAKAIVKDKLVKLEKKEKDLRDKKSAYETRLMARDKLVTELKLEKGDP